jgi:hypothetical protein
MTRRKRLPLEDRDRLVIENELQRLKGKLSDFHETRADKLLHADKDAESSSINALSGGRPESNRRKF